MSPYKFYIVGHGRHGKDTASEIIAEAAGLTWMGSSWFAAERIVFPALKELYGYETVSECFEDRHNHRKEWFDAIKEYGKDDPARFSRELFDKYDIYCGIRNHEEMQATCREGIVDLVIWIDASERLPPEPSTSMTITREMADIVITNNGTEEHFKNKCRAFGSFLTSAARWM